MAEVTHDDDDGRFSKVQNWQLSKLEARSADLKPFCPLDETDSDLICSRIFIVKLIKLKTLQSNKCVRWHNVNTKMT